MPASEDRLSQLLKQHSITLPTPLFSRVLSYISLLPNEETWSEIGDYFATKPTLEQVIDCFEQDLQFGTAGLRAQMGIGNARMNVLTVGKAASGLAAYLPPHSQIILGYDHRHNSLAFAQISVRVFEAAGHVVQVFPEPVPTPFVAGGMRMEPGRFALGIMITASHNPRPDNGYKVYNARGAQILDADAALIAGKIAEIKNLLLSSEIPDFTDNEKLLSSVLSWYQNQLSAWLSVLVPAAAPKVSLKIVYTPMHGVGGKFVQSLMKQLFGTELIPVQEQFDPNPDFPTVKYPNPEEGSSALQLAMATAQAQSADYIFANDPDADRFLIAQRTGTGEWKIFNGNEMAAIFAHFIAENHAEALKDSSKVAMLSSCVSSRFLKRICERKGFKHETTSTGFKNLGNRAQQLQEAGYLPLFAFEEAIGFAVGNWSLDKDGISALLTMTLILTEQRDLLAFLKCIYAAYNASPVQCNGYLIVSKPEQAITRTLKERIPGVAERFPGVSVVEASVKASELELPRGGWLMIRASGTEPKVKYYSESMREQSAEQFEAQVKEIVKFLLE